MTAAARVMLLADVGELAFARVLAAFDLRLAHCADGEKIPGSYWGAPEAGLIGKHLFVRRDTPVHSVLHEACHYICMPPSRRSGLHTNAGGDYEEENCVCCLQIILADFVDGAGRQGMFADMDAWGYTFRLGSAKAWFENDAADALGKLREWGVIDAATRPLWQLRGDKPVSKYDEHHA